MTQTTTPEDLEHIQRLMNTCIEIAADAVQLQRRQVEAAETANLIAYLQHRTEHAEGLGLRPDEDLVSERLHRCIRERLDF